MGWDLKEVRPAFARATILDVVKGGWCSSQTDHMQRRSAPPFEATALPSDAAIAGLTSKQSEESRGCSPAPIAAVCVPLPCTA